jgi:aquaporin Z
MKYIYEFIGTFFLVFTVGMTVMNPGSAGVMAPLAIGSVLAVMVFAGGHVSGGHYNPAVSFSVFLRGKLNLQDMIIYWVFQVAAAVAAAYLAVYMKGAETPTPLELDVVKAFIAEFLFAFALCFVVLHVATDKCTENNSYFGWAIGFTVLVGAYAVGAVSGGAFNPAVALGISIMKLTLFENLWIYIVANLLGGAGAAFIFKAAHLKEKH